MEGIPKNKEQILVELNELKLKFYENPDMYEKMFNFARSLRDKYPNCEDCELFHFMIGSTMKHEPAFFDFPGEDSVESFLRNQ